MFNSRAQRSGRSPRPSGRAAVAGKTACRSSVAVKMMLTMSSWCTPLRSMISRRSSWTRSSICSVVSASSVVAPRKARTAGGTQLNLVLGAGVPVDGREGEAHHGAAVVARLGPDAATVGLDHLLADGEADARARPPLGAAAPVEHCEHGAGLILHQARAVVGDRELPLAGVALGVDVDLERTFGTAVLHRVAD